MSQKFYNPFFRPFYIPNPHHKNQQETVQDEEEEKQMTKRNTKESPISNPVTFPFTKLLGLQCKKKVTKCSEKNASNICCLCLECLKECSTDIFPSYAIYQPEQKRGMPSQINFLPLRLLTQFPPSPYTQSFTIISQYCFLFYIVFSPLPNSAHNGKGLPVHRFCLI